MRLVQGYSEVDTALQQTETTLATVKDRVSDEKGFHVVTASELEQLNSSVRVASEFVKLVKRLGMERIQESERLEEKIKALLDGMTNPYAYATSTWSKDNLAQLDEFSQASIKRILREYFVDTNLTYEGWN